MTVSTGAGPSQDRTETLALLARQLEAVSAPGVSVGGVEPGAGPLGPARAAGKEGGTPALSGAARTAMNVCLRILTAAAQPRAKLAQALQRREVPEDVVHEVLDRLEAMGLVDDAAYAAGYVRAKHRDRALARTGLRRELHRIGVDRETAAAAVGELDDADERRAAESLVARRLGVALQAGPIGARRRLMGLLARRGYSPGLAASVVGQALANTDFDGFTATEDLDPQSE